MRVGSLCTMMMMMSEKLFMCRDKAVGVSERPLLHQQLSCACTVTSEHESVFVCSAGACCTHLLLSFLITAGKALDYFEFMFDYFSCDSHTGKCINHWKSFILSQGEKLYVCVYVCVRVHVCVRVLRRGRDEHFLHTPILKLCFLSESEAATVQCV